MAPTSSQLNAIELSGFSTALTTWRHWLAEESTALSSPLDVPLFYCKSESYPDTVSSFCCSSSLEVVGKADAASRLNIGLHGLWIWRRWWAPSDRDLFCKQCLDFRVLVASRLRIRLHRLVVCCGTTTDALHAITRWFWSCAWRNNVSYRPHPVHWDHKYGNMTYLVFFAMGRVIFWFIIRPLKGFL